MSMNVGPSDAEDEINSTINTTPLVDIMLVLLIIFLVTIPVIIKSVQIELPVASNIVTVTKPENIIIAVDTPGNFYWNDEPVATTTTPPAPGSRRSTASRRSVSPTSAASAP